MTTANSHAAAMREAIVAAKQSPRAPFGAVLVNREGEVVARGVNNARANPTLHGEIDVINRHASTAASPNWQDLTLYTTAEPCPMCMAAIHWAGIGRVVYGTSVPTLTAEGWHQFSLRASDIEAAAFNRCEIIGGVLEADCDALFQDAIAERS